jgi:UDP-N-acetylmuramoyl-L-alanyl-D-glutamate--2,6-diaminopimelate ligase
VRTTPEAIDLQRTFAEMLDAGDEAVVMEVSSHALALHRADAIHWAVAVVHEPHARTTSTSTPTWRTTSRPSGGSSSAAAAAVVNVDDAYGARLAASSRTRSRIGLDSPDAQLRADVSSRRRRLAPSRRRPRAAHRAARALQRPQRARRRRGRPRCSAWTTTAIAAALPRADRVPGRFEPVDEGQPFAVFVDYAHKPDALEPSCARRARWPRRRVLVVFGAGGDRDRAKRPLMGASPRERADVAIVTSDNPRSEDPEAILARSPRAPRPRPSSVVDRREAIARASRRRRRRRRRDRRQGPRARTRSSRRRTVPFDDVAVAREALPAARRRAA